jgi:hypothetical protein
MQQAFQNSLNWTVGIVTGGVKTSVYPTFQGVFGDTIWRRFSHCGAWCLFDYDAPAAQPKFGIPLVDGAKTKGGT